MFKATTRKPWNPMRFASTRYRLVLRSLLGPASLATVLSIRSVYAAGVEVSQPARGASIADNKEFVIQSQQGLLSFRINDVSLKEVMERLALDTATKVVLTDPVIASRPVSVTSKPVPVQEAIERLLDGFSYALYRVVNRYALIVLSTPPRPRQGGCSVAKAAVGFAAKSPVHCGSMLGKPHAAVDTTPSGVAVPPSLDESSPSQSAEGSFDPEILSPPTSDEDGEYYEAVLQQALNGLEPGQQHLDPEAIDALADLNDPRATEALIKAATHGPFRFNAVEALGRHAALLEFAEESSMSALQRFAEDRERAIRQLAQQTLASVPAGFGSSTGPFPHF